MNPENRQQEKQLHIFRARARLHGGIANSFRIAAMAGALTMSGGMMTACISIAADQVVHQQDASAAFFTAPAPLTKTLMIDGGLAFGLGLGGAMGAACGLGAASSRRRKWQAKADLLQESYAARDIRDLLQPAYKTGAAKVTWRA